jgi:hypothetical protein
MEYFISNIPYYIFLAIEGFVFCFALYSRGYRDIALGIFTLCLGLSFFSDLLGEIIMVLGFWNAHINNFYVVVDFTLMIYFFHLITDKKAPTIYFSLIALWLAFSLGFVFFGPGEFGIYSSRIEIRVVRNILGIVFLLIWVYRQIENPKAEVFTELPLFWIFSGLLVYYGGSLFLFLFRGFVFNYLKETGTNLWAFHNTIAILKNILYFIGFYKYMVNFNHPKTPRPLRSSTSQLL